MKLKLLIIDPQNDFCDGGALAVPGASADMWRLTHLIKEAGDALSDILVTLDSHPQVAIERVSFWVGKDGQPIAPFTEVTEEAVREGRFLPRLPQHTPRVLQYLHALEARGRHRLIVWPVHCVLGTQGHAVHAPLAEAIANWETERQCAAMRVLKGLNPMTEQYSAISAEVPVDEDLSTFANQALLSRARPAAGEYLLIAGEASSHCARDRARSSERVRTPRARPHGAPYRLHEPRHGL